MPQWSRNRASNRRKYPDERWGASCAAPEAPLLHRWDHHTVWIEGRRALLLTAPWANTAQAAVGQYAFAVSFTYAAGHPAAPVEVQRLVERLSFRPLNAEEERAD
jgi:hypothetical protein